METRSKKRITRAESEAKSPEDLYNRLPACVAKKTLMVIQRNKVTEGVEFKVITKPERTRRHKPHK